MIQNEKRDPLRDLNWSAVYSDVPEDFEPAIRFSFQRIRSHERRKKNIIRIAACAAAVAVFAGLGLRQMSKREIAPDHVDVVLAAPTVITAHTPVFSTLDDPHLHIDSACPKTIDNEVEIQLITALEFEKTPCPDCCANAKFEQTTK